MKELDYLLLCTFCMCTQSRYELHGWAYAMWIFFAMHVDAYTCMCVWRRTGEHVCLRVLNLCFALKDGEGRIGSQSVPLQINSLIPDPSFLQNNHYLQRLSPSIPPPPSSLPPVSPLLLPYTSPRLSVNQATWAGLCVFAWESDESVDVEVV